VQYQLFTAETLQPQQNNDTLYAHEPILLLAEIKPLPSYPLMISKTDLVINTLEGSTEVAKLLSSTGASSTNIIVTRHTRHAAWFKIVPTIPGDSFSFGHLVVYWKRHDPTDIDAPFTITKSPLPQLKISRPYFSVAVDAMATGVVGEPISHSITISNHTSLPQDFSLLIIPQSLLQQQQQQPTQQLPQVPAIPSTPISPSPTTNLKASSSQIMKPVPSLPTPNISDVFLISGDRQTNFSIHPHSSYVIRHNLLPMVAGNHLRPHVQIISKRFNKELPQTRFDERFIFVRPNLNLQQ